MFSYSEPIEDRFLWNFSPLEKRHIYQEQKKWQACFAKYQIKLYRLLSEDSPAIFSNDEPSASLPLEIKYTFNRLYQNDPRETELTLDHCDPIPDKRDSYVDRIVWALKNNTYCRTIILNGIQTTTGLFKRRGLNDTDAQTILKVLRDKKLQELTITGAPLLSETTFSSMADFINTSTNKWHHITLGNISVTTETAKRLEQTGKVGFHRVIHQPNPIGASFKSFASNVINRMLTR